MAEMTTKAINSGLSRLGTLWGTPPLPLPQPFREQGSGGTPVWGGYVSIKDTSPKWVGRQRWRTASDLAVNVSVVAAGIHYFIDLISHPKWVAQPSDPTSGEAKDMADFVNNVLANTRTPWANIVKQAGMHRFHGFSTQEWIAAVRPQDGLVGLDDIEVRPQHTIERWAMSQTGSMIGVFQRNPQDNQLLGLPRDKLIYVVEDTLTDSPEGIGVFRHLAEPYNRLKRFMELEARAYERDLRGIPIGRAPLSAINEAVRAGNLTQAQADTLILGMQQMLQTQVKQSDTAILLDSQPYLSTTAGGPTVATIQQWAFELLSGPALGLTEISNAIDRVQREMARVMGVEHLMMGGDQSGGRAVAQDKSRNVYLIASSVLRLIVAAMQRDLLGPLWALNGFDDRTKPKLMAEDIAPKDVVEIATALARMSQSGAVLAPDDPAINDVRDLLGISHVKPIESEVVGPLSDVAISDYGEAGPLPRNLLPIGSEGEIIAPGTGEVDAEGNPKPNPEMQRLPRNTAVGASTAKHMNGRA